MIANVVVLLAYGLLHPRVRLPEALIFPVTAYLLLSIVAVFAMVIIAMQQAHGVSFWENHPRP